MTSTELINSTSWSKFRESNDVNLTYDQIDDVASYVNSALADDYTQDELTELIIEAVDKVLTQFD